MRSVGLGILFCAASALALHASPGRAEEPPVKIGVIWSYSGPAGEMSSEFDAAVGAYMEAHGDSVAGRKIVLIKKDTTGVPSPDISKRLAQELIVQDKVDFIAGGDFTPNAIAIGQVSTASKTPTVIVSTLGINVLQNAPYMIRLFGTIPQTMVPTAAWLGQQGVKSVYLAYADYGPGRDTAEWFGKAFAATGGTITGKIPLSIKTVDFSAEMQRMKDAKPDAVFVWLPSGPLTSIFIRQYREAGLDTAGIHLYSDGDLTDDYGLQSLGDDALGLVTSYQYSYAHDSALNQAFAKSFIKLSGGAHPDAIGAAAYDAMALMYKAIADQGGKLDPDKTMAIWRGLKFESPRGMVQVDPNNRDLIQDIYMRKVEKRNGELVNTEFKRIEAVVPVPEIVGK